MAKVFTITEGLENMGALKMGGQGSVYKGRRNGEIITAIKILPTPIFSETADDKNYTSFQNEVQKLWKVNEDPNPNVVKILSSGITESGNFPFIEMEFIEGPDLEELLKPPHDPVFTIKEALKVAEHLSLALSHCHSTDVKHGDIKSNNVKYNTNTGNYVLLDFGLAVMSDEQRRTSLRHAGAIEFMAPEQNEGLMLFQTDVYSFGVILFELLAGSVPFPLNDKSETGRNMVMVAHMEKPPPDLISIRKMALPPTWNEQKKEHELLVPEWLISLVYKCLEKKPQDRFANGMKLHKFIWENNIRTVNQVQLVDERINFLEQENKRLRQERETLQQQVLQYQRQPSGVLSNNAVTGNKALQPPLSNPGEIVRPKVSLWSKKAVLPALALLLLAAIGLFLFYRKYSTLNAYSVAATGQKKVIGSYKVIVPKAYFYNDADEETRRNAFAVPTTHSISAFDDKNGFIYTEIANEKGQTSKGWLLKQDLMTVAEYAKRSAPATATLDVQTRAQLQNAKQFLRDNKTVEALTIYSAFSKKEVPEAMYQYAKLALQNINKNIDCTQAFDLLKRAAGKGYTPAKQTLGFLYANANDKEMLQQNLFYDRCNFGENLQQGSRLLMEATLEGDTTASRLLDQLNIKQSRQ